MNTMSTHRAGMRSTLTISLSEGLVGSASGADSSLSAARWSAGYHVRYTMSMPTPNAEPSQKLIIGLMLNTMPATSATIA